MNDYEDDYRYSEEAMEHDLRIVWKCDICGQTRKDYPGCNAEGIHDGCGGNWRESGESYIA